MSEGKGERQVREWERGQGVRQRTKPYERERGSNCAPTAYRNITLVFFQINQFQPQLASLPGTALDVAGQKKKNKSARIIM